MDRAYGVQIKGDGSGLVGALTQSADAGEKLEKQLEKTAAAGKSTAEQTKQHVEALKQQTGAANDASRANDFLMQSMGRGNPIMRAAISSGGLWGAALVAIGAAAIGAYTSHERFERQLNRTEAAMTAQGRAGEILRSQIAGLERELSLMPGVSMAAAQATVTAFAQMRDIGGTHIVALSRITADYARATGQEVPAAAQSLAKAFADPVKGAKSLDDQLGILTAAQLIAIQRFNELGETAKAQDVLFGALRDRVEGLNEKALTPLERKLASISRIWPVTVQVISQGWSPYEFEAEGVAPSMGQVYSMRGFEGDTRDIRAADARAARAAREDSAKAMLGRYDREGTRRRELEADIGRMQGLMGSGELDPEVYRRLAEEIAAARKELADLNGATRLIAQDTANWVRHAEQLQSEFDKQIYTFDALGNAVAMSASDYKEFLRATEEAERVYQRSSEQLFRHTDRLAESNQKLREHVEQIGLTKEQLEQVRLRREGDELAMAEQALAMDELRDKDDAYNQALREQVRLLRERRELQAAAVTRQQQVDAERASKEEAARIQRTLESAVLSAFRGGSVRGAEVLKAELESAVAKAVLRPLIRPILEPISQWMTSAVSGIMGGGMSSLGGMASALGLGGVFGGGAAAASPELLAGAGIGAGIGGAVPLTALGGGIGGMGWAPWAGAALYAAQGKWGGAGGTLGGAALGTMIMPGIGTAIGAIAGGFLGDSIFPGGGGQTKNPQLGIFRGWNGNWYVSQKDLAGDEAIPLYTQFANILNDRTKYDQAALDTMSGYIEGTPGMSPQQMIAMLSQRLSSAALPDLNALGKQQTALYQQLYGVREQLPGMLGITGLQAYRDALSVSEFAGGPLDQLGSARSIYEATLARARAGDRSAIAQLPQVSDTFLRLGRGAYASGAEYQSIYASVRGSVDEIIEQQTTLQTEILKDLPTTIKQSSIDQVAAVREQTKDIVGAIKALEEEMERVRKAIGS